MFQVGDIVCWSFSSKYHIKRFEVLGWEENGDIVKARELESEKDTRIFSVSLRKVDILEQMYYDFLRLESGQLV